MGRNKKTETAKAEETAVIDTQVSEEATTSEPTTEPEAQPSNEIEKAVDTSDTAKVQALSEKSESAEKISPREAELMRLYPQYEKIWITPKGFVHPEGAPEYLLKGAKLFKNKFFNK